MLSDEHLMAKVKEGELDLLKLLFERYQRLLYNFYLKSLGNPALSADLTQDVFYRVLKYKSSFKASQKFRPWLFQIARNARNDTLRKEKKYAELADIENHEETVSDEFSGNAIEKREALSMLKMVLSKMPIEKRELITLSLYTDLPVEEVAEVFKITPNNARVRLHRALNELKEEFKRSYNYGE